MDSNLITLLFLILGFTQWHSSAEISDASWSASRPIAEGGRVITVTSSGESRAVFSSSEEGRSFIC